MQIQSIQNNNPSFEANLTIKDKGKCFSFFQKRNLTKFAKSIGASSDYLFLGTRKYKTRGLDCWGEEIFWDKKDIIILALINDTKREIIIPHRTIKKLLQTEESNLVNNDKNDALYNYVIKHLKVLAGTSLEDSKKCSKENIKDLKAKLKDFCSLKHTYHKETLLEKWQKIIKFLFPERKVRKKTPDAKYEKPPKEPWEYEVERWNGKREYERDPFEGFFHAIDNLLG